MSGCVGSCVRGSSIPLAAPPDRAPPCQLGRGHAYESIRIRLEGGRRTAGDGGDQCEQDMPREPSQTVFIGWVEGEGL